MRGYTTVYYANCVYNRGVEKLHSNPGRLILPLLQPGRVGPLDSADKKNIFLSWTVALHFDNQKIKFSFFKFSNRKVITRTSTPVQRKYLEFFESKKSVERKKNFFCYFRSDDIVDYITVKNRWEEKKIE